MVDVAPDWISLTDAAGLLGLRYQPVWTRAVAGELGPIERRGRSIFLERQRVLEARDAVRPHAEPAAPR